jgi:Ca-activated chloride channel homolog
MIPLAAVLLLAGAARQEPPVFRAEVGLVRVEVLVTRKGVPVHGLSSADFEVRDDGQVQELEPVLEEESPVDVALLLDTSGSVKGPKLDALRDAARAFLDGLKDGDEAAVLAFREQIQLLQPFTPERAAARRTLEQVSPGGSTALVDAVYAALRLREPGPRRTAIVTFSDGLDSMSWLAPGEVVEAASRTDAIVYGVAVRPKQKEDAQPSFLRDVCRATGGRLFEIEDERHLRVRFLDVLADIRARYVLSFYPEAGAVGRHALAVRLKRSTGEVLARPAYWRYATKP